MGNYYEKHLYKERRLVTKDDLRALKMEKVHEAFDYTVEDFEYILEQLAEGIREGRWNSILGDDISGRFVANVIGKIATRYARENNMEVPKRFYFAGGSRSYPDSVDFGKLELKTTDEETAKKEKQERLEEYITIIAPGMGKRVLVVTEHLVTGNTAKRIGRALRKAGVSFDIASLHSTKSVHEMKDRFQKANEPSLIHADVYIGHEYASPSDPWGSSSVIVGPPTVKLDAPLKEATGVKKSGTNPVVMRNEDADPVIVALAREKEAKLVDALYQKFFR